MKIDLTFEDIVALAANGKLEKGGATITFGRPVLAEITLDPRYRKSGKVVFYLDEHDKMVRR